MDHQAKLLSQQEELGQAIEHLIRNVKKDSKDRKTRAYYKERLSRLIELWRQFTENHTALMEQEELQHDHSYIKKGYYSGIKNLVEAWMEIFQNEIETAVTLEGATAKTSVQDSSTGTANNTTPVLEMQFSTQQTMGSTPASNEPSLTNSVLFNTQNALMESLMELKERILTDGFRTHNKSFYHGKARLIVERLERMEAIDNQISSSSQPLINGYSTRKFLKFQEEMRELVDELNEASITSSEATTAPSSKEDHEIPLPKIQLPKFDGNFSQWTQFKELFVELIHKKQISEVQKMYYLSTFMTGDAKNLIKHLTMSPENYDVAWNIVTSRYDNKRLLVTALMNKFLSQPYATSESASTLKELHDVTTECMHGLKAQGIPVDQWDVLVAHILVKKLDRNTHAAFEQTLADNKNPVKLESVMKFLEHRFQSLEALGKVGKPTSTKTSASVVKSKQAESRCNICNGEAHQLYTCSKFKDDTLANKWQWVKKLKLCSNCLKFGHKAIDCKSGHCKHCQKKHHSTLHSKLTNQQDTSNQQVPTSTQASNQLKDTSTTSLLSGDALTTSKYVLLGTARIIVTASNGQQIECRAILDSGSQINVVTEKLVKKLNARPNATNLHIEGIGKTSKISRHRVNVNVYSRVTNFTTSVEAHVLPQIVSKQPSQNIDTTKWKLPRNIELADPDFNKSGKVDLLLGAEFYHQLLCTGNISIGENLPIMQNSVFGWIIAGKVQQPEELTAVCGVCSENDLEEAISQFWKIEEVNESTKSMTVAEKLCEDHFLLNTTKTQSGRLMVKIPLSGDINLIGESKRLAYNRLIALEKRLAKNEDLKQQYTNFMREYEHLGHMTEIAPQNVSKPHYFIPHHCVLRPESTSTKLRVVFDASAKTTSGISLNELMHTGRTVQSDLFSILLRFRMPRFVFKTDIEKMYRQILVHPEDRMLQLIMWRTDTSQPVKCFQLNTVTYGTRAAPFLATRCLKKLAEENEKKFPAGSIALKYNFYVDDGLAGADSIVEAIEIQNQLTTILKTAGMNPKKWSANCSRLMQGVATEDQEINLDFDNNSNEAIKTLGLRWLPTSDEFCIKVAVNTETRITKRQVTSELARIFDPLGLIAPVVVTAKIFIQQLWGLQLDWDTTIPAELHARWLNFRTNLQALSSIKIPRHVFHHQGKRSIQLHVFSDASERAYGACIYIRTTRMDKSISVRLLCSKNRVAPLKTLTIPRLELCAAVLGAELTKRVKEDLNLQDAETYYWSDSQIVLAWINQRSSAFQAFVAHRVGKIQQLSNITQWRYVPSKHNPADVLSRGVNPQEFESTHIWFYGPIFLHQAQEAWAVPLQRDQLEKTSLERKQNSPTIAISLSSLPFIHTISAKNDFRTLQRVFGYILRFAQNSRQVKSSRHESLQLSPSELSTSLRYIVKEVQQHEFKETIKTLSKGDHLPNSHALSSLSPFLDEEGLLRVGGRMSHSSQNYDSRHQMILPYNDPTVKLLMEAIHRENLHCTAQSLMNIVRQQFWPIKVKQMARSIVNHCIRCRRAKPTLYNQMMGQLPAARVEPARPFLTTGVDYCGPFKIHFNIRGKHPQKAYVAIFCCFVTKAVHLELVSNLTTEAFIGALKRFTALRGHCKTLYSDNATNFVGARNIIQEAVLSNDAQEKIIRTCSMKGIEFRFIPPRSPHFGGLWEAAVKSAKHLLVRSTEAASLTDEQLRTIIAEIGAILNSRPLTPMSNDPNDLNALTPGHFLIGEPMISTIDERAVQSSSTLQTHWKRVTQIRKEFWERWRMEYLTNLQQKHKWKGPATNIKEGTMVILKDDSLPVLQWPLGRIVHLYKGDDDIVRVVDVKTEKGIFTRAIHRLAPLFYEDQRHSMIEKSTSRDEDQNGDHNQESTTSLPVSIPLNRIKTTNIMTVETIPAKRPRLNQSMIFTIITLLLLPLALSNHINVTQLPNKPGIHFEEAGQVKLTMTNWKIIVYFDLAPFKRDVTLLSSGMADLVRICSKTRNRPPCDLMLKHLNKIEEDLVSGFDILSRRKKRGAIDIVGNLANSLFGVLDSNYEQQMSKTIKHLQGNEDHLVKLLRNQTSLVDSTINIMKQDEENVKIKFNELDEQINTINAELSQGTALSLCVQLLALSSSLLQTRSSILDVLIDSHHGKVNPYVLTPHQLAEEIRKIRIHLPSHLQLPAMQENILQFYKLMEVDGVVAQNHIIFTINLPLMDSRTFHLHYLTPITAILNNTLTTVKLSAAWLAINDHRDEYFTMTESTLKACSQININLFLCSNIQSTLRKGSTVSICELDLFNDEPMPSCELQPTSQGVVWHQLYNKNQWIFATKQVLRMTTVCREQSDIVSIFATGIIELQAECTLKGDDITIYGQQLMSTTLQGGYTAIGVLPPNLSEKLAVRSSLNPYETQIDKLTKIQEQFKNQELGLPTEVQSTITHSLGIAYGSLGLVLCSLILFTIGYGLRKRKKKIEQLAPAKPPRMRSSFDISTL